MDVLLLSTSLSFLFVFQKPQPSQQLPWIEKSTNNETRSISKDILKREFTSNKTRSKHFRFLTTNTRITLCLSACLFSLCFLETMPSSWLLILSKHSKGDNKQIVDLSGRLYVHLGWKETLLNTFNISFFYKIFLWTYCVWIIFVIPVSLSILCVEKFGSILSSSKLSSSYMISTITRGLVRTLGIVWWILRHAFCSCFGVIVFQLYLFLRTKIRRNTGAYVSLDHGKDKHKKGIISLRFMPKIHTRRKIFHRIFGFFFGIISSFLCLELLGWKQTSAISIHFDKDQYPFPQYALVLLVSRISNIGVLLSTLLNGFGSVSLPHSFFMAIYMKNVLTPHNLSRKEADLLHTRSFLEKRKERMIELSSRNELSVPSAFTNQTQSSLSSSSNISLRRFWKRKPLMDTQEVSTKESGEMSSLAAEIKRLEAICQEQEEDYNELKEMIRASTIEIFGLKTLGKFLGAIFTVVLWIRVSNALRICLTLAEESISSEILSEPSKRHIQSDRISLGLNWLIKKEMIVEHHFNFCSQLLSFLLTVYLSISQIATFSRMLSTIRKKYMGLASFFFRKKEITFEGMNTQMLSTTSSTSNSVRSASSIGDLLINVIMGSYFLSCVVILKMTLPIDYGIEFWEGLGQSRFHLDTKLINEVFLFSVCLSGVVLGFSLRKQTLSSKMDNTFSSIALDSFFYFGSGV